LAEQPISVSLVEWFVTPLYTFLGYSNSTSNFFDQIVILNGDETCWKVISSLDFPDFLCIKQPISALVARGTVEGRNSTLPFLCLFNAQCLV
jgi:hypothetical protein